MPTDSNSLLEKVLELNTSPSLGDPAYVERELAVTLKVDPAEEQSYFITHEGHPRETGGDIRAVELRVAKPGEDAKGAFLVITLSSAAALTGAQVLAKFGEPRDLHPPSPEASRQYSALYEYRLNGKPVMFAVAPKGSDKIVTISIDHTQ